MIASKSKPKTFSELIGENHRQTMETLDRLQDVLTRLRYEGRHLLGRNLKSVEEILDFFNGELNWRIYIEDEVIFPFLKAHLPKLESLVCFFAAEHAHFRKTLKEIEQLLKDLSRSKEASSQARTTEKIIQAGTYLLYLLRNHIYAEDGSIYRMMDRDLNLQEKRILRKQLVGTRP